MRYLPDADTNYEKAQHVVIGHLLLYPSSAPDVFARVGKEKGVAFSVSALRHIFEVMWDLHYQGVDISEQAVVSRLKTSDGACGSLPSIFVECMDAAENEYRLRELGTEVSDYIRELIDGHHLGVVKVNMQRANSFPEAVSVAEEAIGLDTGNRCEYQRTMDDIVDEMIDVQTAIAEGRQKPGCSWGVPSLDEAMIIRPRKLYTVAAQKGAGKTKFLLSVIGHNSSLREGKVPCLLFSLEMSDLEVVKYLASRGAQVDSSLIFTRALPDQLFDDIKFCSEAMRRSPVEIDGSPSLTVREIVSRIRQWKIKRRIPDGLGLVGVDFLQLVSLDRQRGQVSEATALKNTAYDLAEAAKTMNVSIIVAAQLNKQGDGVKPQIGFIEGSGGLAQASQGVLLLDLVRLREPDRATTVDGLDEFNIIVAKNRDGESMVTVPCKADLSIGKFIDATPAQLSLIK